MKNPSQISENRPLSDKNVSKIGKNGALGAFWDLLGDFGASDRFMDGSGGFGASCFGVFWPENGRPGGDLGSQAGRQVSLKLSFLIKNDEKIHKKLIEEGFHKKLGKIMEK